MEFEAIVTLIVILISFILFATEKLSVDHIAIGIIVVLGSTGVLTPEESLEGFSNSATLTVAAMFIMSSALIKMGIVESIGPFFTRLIEKSKHLAIFSLTAIVGSISAFVNNTPVVATFIPVVTNASNKAKKSPSKLLIPLSFGAILGGSCTLIGTSTNLLVNGIAKSNGLEGFTMFQFAPLGLVFMVVGIVYLMLFSDRLLPERSAMLNDEEGSAISDYLTEIKVIGNKKVIQKDNSEEKKEIRILETQDLKEEDLIAINEVFSSDDNDVTIEKLIRDKKMISDLKPTFLLKTGDILLVRGNLKRIKEILKNEVLEMTEKFGDDIFPNEETKAIEVVITPNSRLLNKRLIDLDYFDRYHARVLAIRQRGKQREVRLEHLKLQAGDVLLLQTNERGHQLIRKAESKRLTPFLSLSESGIEQVNKSKLILVAGVITSIILLATLNLVPLVIGAFAGIFILVLSKTITMEDAYQSVDWKVIFLLAGALSLGVAMNKTGLSSQLAGLIQTHVASNFGPIAVISALYLVTSLLTETMSNNAAAALLAPIAISLSQGMELNPTPFLIAITFAGSASFITPIGYQTNTMVYSVGNYRFNDFIKIGLPLNIIFWILATFLIPFFYPL